jgi:hypothetical protein
MAVRASSISAFQLDSPGTAQASDDVRTYFVAIRSYPDYFAVGRRVSFRRHLLMLMGATNRRSGRNSRRCRTVN